MMKIHHTLLCIAATFALLTGLAPAAPFAYVPNEKSGTISIIDIATDTVTGVIPAGKRPRGIAISPDGKFIYVSDQPSNGIHVIDVAASALLLKLLPCSVAPAGQTTVTGG
jgi:YVTN family beta-propeller protein